MTKKKRITIQFPLPDGDASISIPRTITSEDFNLIMKFLEIAKPGLVREESMEDEG